MSFRWPSPALSPWCWPLSLFPSPISPASSWWPAFCSPAKWFGSSRSALRQPTPAQPVCLQAIAGRLEPWLLDTRSFCPAFLHTPTIGQRRAKLARAPTGQSPHFNSKAATALPRAHSRSARTTSDTSASSPQHVIHFQSHPGSVRSAPIARRTAAIYTWVGGEQFRFTFLGPCHASSLSLDETNCTFSLCPPSNLQPRKRYTPT